ncbi:MAG: hypothetical protein JNK67_16110 [Alphaproteobacteria bacterium]|nr:hypothetical protein [Alphaproteobacteria bacterium]
MLQSRIPGLAPVCDRWPPPAGLGRLRDTMGPAIRIHSLAEARIALDAARALGRPVTLVSARGAAGYAGPGWWRALVAIARSEYPDVAMTTLLDCDDAAGDVLASLREGVERVRFGGRADVAAKLRAIAVQLGAEVVVELPLGLDLGGLRDPRLACRVWLRDDPAPVEGRRDD